jgi:hypothetical protein
VLAFRICGKLEALAHVVAVASEDDEPSARRHPRLQRGQLAVGQQSGVGDDERVDRRVEKRRGPLEFRHAHAFPLQHFVPRADAARGAVRSRPRIRRGLLRSAEEQPRKPERDDGDGHESRFERRQPAQARDHGAAGNMASNARSDRA